MKIYVASDLHDEVWPHDWDVPENLDFDVAVFAGDLHRGAESVRWLRNQRALWHKQVLFVAGNHEYYGSVLQDAAAQIRDRCRGTNVTFLDADVVPVIDGVRFLGCTLWTDYCFEADSQPHGLHAGRFMNDHKHIRTSGGAEFPVPFTPAEAYKRHVAERRWLTDRLAEEHDVATQTVVITHHAPHPGSLHERFADDGAINSSFISDLSGIISEHQPALWIHGHVHDSHDYMVGTTRLVCNPRGYSRGGPVFENSAGFIEDLVVEIPDLTPRPRPF